MAPETFTNHPVFEKLEQLNNALTAEGAKEKFANENLHFFETALHYIKDRLKLTLPILVQEAEMTSLSSEIEAGTAQLNSFLGNNNIGHVNNATNNINSAINRVKNLPFPLTKGDFDFAKSITGFQRLAQEGYKSLEEANGKLQEALKSTETDLLTKKQQIESLEKLLAEKETEIKNALSKHSTEFETQKSKSAADIEEEKKKFNTSIEADRKGFKEKFDADNEGYKKTFSDTKIALDNQSKQIVDDLNSKLNEAKNIVNIIGNVGVTGNYQKIANQHKWSAEIFRGIALFFMILMSGLLIWSILDLSSGEFNLYKSLVRILAAAVLTYPAVYASRESTRHRNLETKNRNLELELASIGPFIELLPEDKKQKIKEDLVNKYFGHNSTTLTDKSEEGEDVSINLLEKLLKALLPFIKK